MKNKFPILILMVILTALLSSCATTGPKISKEELQRKQDEFNAKFFEAAQDWLPRVYRVGYQLVSHHVPEHGDETPKYGFVGLGVDELKKYSKKAYHIDDSVKGVLVLGLYPGSKAENVDVKPGDVIQKVNGEDTRSLDSYFSKIKGSKGDQVQAKIWRKGTIIERELPIEKVYYNAHFFLEATPSFDANSLFSRINVGIGAIRYCRNDDELAFIMGHELAHTTRKHSLKKMGTGIGTALAYGALAGTIDVFLVPGVGTAIVSPMQTATNNKISRDYEREADYYGMKHVFHSGYSITNGFKVLPRLATDSPRYNVLAIIGTTHPDWPERVLRMEKTLEEFKTKFPEQYTKLEDNHDWDVSVAVRPGESVEEALERMLEEKKLKLEKAEEISKTEIFWNTFEINSPQPKPATVIANSEEAKAKLGETQNLAKKESVSIASSAVDPNLSAQKKAA